jgi:hypothetical protein
MKVLFERIVEGLKEEMKREPYDVIFERKAKEAFKAPTGHKNVPCLSTIIAAKANNVRLMAREYKEELANHQTMLTDL